MGKPKTRKLPIRSRTVVSGGGGTTRAQTIWCPAHGEAVALSVCAECEHCEKIDAGGVECRPESARPAMRWTPLLRRMLPSAADRVAIAAVMTRDVTCVRPDVSLEALAALLLDANIGAVPVVDDEGFPIGLVSKTDLVRVHAAAVAGAKVADVMMPFAFTLREDDPLSRAAAIMSVERVHHLPIVSADGRVVGMLSSLDFVRWVAAQSGYDDQA